MLPASVHKVDTSSISLESEIYCSNLRLNRSCGTRFNAKQSKDQTRGNTSSASYKDTPGKEVIFAFSDCRLKVHFKVGRSTKYMTSGTVCSGAIRVMLY